ncbi:MAG: Gfo/Idh/MocA family oxidoreductase [Planctomycetaceae bacterium]|nr:Gfo/Idh/MocA family oxidoreductase [Planctomycetaceae bacterium]
MNTRRDFLQSMTLAIGGAAFLSGCTDSVKSKSGFLSRQSGFNMCGYRAPKMPTVRVAFVGLGNRGPGAVKRMTYIEGIEIAAICDKRKSCTDRVEKMLSESGFPKPAVYTDSEDAWKGMCQREDIDLVYIATPWELHAPMAVYAMEHGKHAATEVPAATTLDECWQLVETSERTRKHCVILENCCYDFFEMLTLNMVRQGLFGDLVHGEGAYIHNLVGMNFSKDSYADMWRLKENARRNGNLYPTHGLGPICQCMDINRGDRMDHLTCMASNDFTMNAEAKRRAAEDSFYAPFVNGHYRGNINTTLIRTFKGRTIMIQHDVSSPRPYSRIHLLSGTKAFAQKWPKTMIAFGDEAVSQEKMQELYKMYSPEIVSRIGEMAQKVGGHGGMDFLMDWSLINSLRNGLPVDMDCYDAALWSCITPLSIKSIAQRSNSVDVPDFTRGNWKTNQPVSLKLEAITGVKEIHKADSLVQLNV